MLRSIGTSRAAVVATAMIVAALPAQASAGGGTIKSAFLPAGEIADAPTGFIDFCQRDRRSCAAGLPLDAPDAGSAPTTASDPIAPEWRRDDGDAPPLLASAGWTVPAALFRFVTPATAWPDAAPAPVRFQPATLILGATAWSATAPPFPSPAAAAPPPAAAAPPPAAAPAPAPAPIAARPLSADRQWALVRKINAAVNRQVIQETDRQISGVDERWQRPDPARHPVGDCEDIAIEKRMRLIEAGFPPEALFYAAVYRPGLQLHTVLVARLASGDRVLDSLSPRVSRWYATPYVWLRQQQAGDPMTWHRVGGASTVVAVNRPGRGA